MYGTYPGIQESPLCFFCQKKRSSSQGVIFKESSETMDDSKEFFLWS